MALVYGTPTAITITAGSLAASTSRSSAAVTTTTSVNVTGILLAVSVQTTAVAPTDEKQVVVLGYTSLDGTNYSGANGTVDNVDGTDKALASVGSPSNLIYLGTIQLNQGAVATTIRAEFEITQNLGVAFPKWGIVLRNAAGTALGSAVSATYREVSFT